MSFDIKKMGLRIRELREAQGLSEAAMSQIVGTSRSHLGNIEHGRRTANYEVAAKLCEYFDVSMDYLMGLTDNLKHFRGSDEC